MGTTDDPGLLGAGAAGFPVLDVVVTAIETLAAGVRLYEFGARDGGALPAAEAGAHIDLHLPGGLVRPYSLMTSGPAPHRYRIGVKRQDDGRGGSRLIHDTLAVGQGLRIGPPRNNFPLFEAAAETVFIAGGIGVTPLWSMAQRLSALGRPWTLHYFCRSQADVIAPPEMAPAPDRVRLLFTASATRRPSSIADIVRAAADDAHLYCCGPLPMLRDFEEATAGLAAERVHLEYFSSDVDVATEGDFVIQLARSGLRLPVPSGQTIVQVLAGAGITVLSQCTQGYCGTCETRVLSGVPDHRDVVLTRAEKASNTVMMVCCSRSLTRTLVLDL
jgi:vanillate O-demethylase ferredoxin subunit